MEIIPLIHLQKRKITGGNEGNHLSFNDLLQQVDKDEKIYLLDIDGIKKDKPNLCIYRSISEHRKIWVDSGPRVLGDIVDAVMAGATDITVRKSYWPTLDIYAIQEMTECDIYVDIDLKSQTDQHLELSLFYDVNGFVSFNVQDEIEGDFKARSILKNLCKKYKIYIYDPNPKNLSYWKERGVTGLLIDISMIRSFKKHGF